MAATSQPLPVKTSPSSPGQRQAPHRLESLRSCSQKDIPWSHPRRGSPFLSVCLSFQRPPSHCHRGVLPTQNLLTSKSKLKPFHTPFLFQVLSYRSCSVHQMEACACRKDKLGRKPAAQAIRAARSSEGVSRWACKLSDLTPHGALCS